MSRCTNPKLGNMIYAYELGALNDDDRRQFEVHLVECGHCFDQIISFEQTIGLMRTDEQVKHEISQLGSNDSDQIEAAPVRDLVQLRKWSRLIVAAAAVILFLLVNPWELKFRSTSEVVASEPLLAIMYFGSLADIEDDQRLGEIFCDLMINDLSESGYVQVLSGQRLYDVLRQLGHEGSKKIEPSLATQVALRSQAKWMLTGQILQVQPHIILTSQLSDVSTGRVIGSQRVEAGSDETIFALTDRLAAQVKADLSIPADAYLKRDPALTQSMTASVDAYRLYLDGLEDYYSYRNEVAAPKFERAIGLDSSFAMAYYRLFMCRGDDWSIGRALELADRVPDLYQRYIRAAAFEHAREYDSARIVYDSIVILNPNEKEATYRLGLIYAGTRKRAEAIAQFEAAIRIDPTFKRPYYQLSREYTDDGNIDMAIWAISEYIKLAPDESVPYKARADLYALTGRVDNAVSDLRTALSLSPGKMSYVDRLAGLFLLTERYAAIDSLVAAQNFPATTDLTLWRFSVSARKLRHQGKFNDALDVLQAAVTEAHNRGDQQSEGWYHLWRSAIYFYFVDNPGRAIEEIESAERTIRNWDERSNDLLNMTGAIAYNYAGVGLFNKADSILVRLSHLYENAPLPQKERLYSFRGMVEQERKHYDSALYYLKLAASTTPRHMDLYVLGVCQLEAGHLGDAVQTLERALRTYDWLRWHWADMSVVTHYQLGRAYEESGWSERAIEQYEIFLELWKGADPSVLNKFGVRDRLARLKNPG